MKDIKFQDIYGAKYSPEYVQNSPIAYKDIALEVLNLPWITKRTARHEYFMSDHLVSYTYGNGYNAKVDAKTWCDSIR